MPILAEFNKRDCAVHAAAEHLYRPCLCSASWLSKCGLLQSLTIVKTAFAPLQAAVKESDAAGREPDSGMWRQRLHGYLDALFRRDAAAGTEFADLQVG